MNKKKKTGSTGFADGDRVEFTQKFSTAIKGAKGTLRLTLVTQPDAQEGVPTWWVQLQAGGGIVMDVPFAVLKRVQCTPAGHDQFHGGIVK